LVTVNESDSYISNLLFLLRTLETVLNFLLNFQILQTEGTSEVLATFHTRLQWMALTYVSNTVDYEQTILYMFLLAAAWTASLS